MTADVEDLFRRWSKPSSDTEAQKSANAESMTRDAIRECPVLAEKTVQVFAQGSYRNNTNVRLDSDVDICVRCMDVCICDFSQVPDVGFAQVGLVDASYRYPQFKNDVGAALVRKFGEDGVTRGQKAFDVHENSYRVDADVVAVFEHRRYYRDSNGRLDYLSGTEFHPDNGGKIINWPQQHYESGVKKNRETGNRFKFVTRIIKRLRNAMVEDKIAAANPIPSYLIECLVYNVPNADFGHDRYTDDVRYAIAHLCNNTWRDDECREWGEVNELKYLFRFGQPWSRQAANEFVKAAWTYVGFE
jgi:hypothetical protein